MSGFQGFEVEVSDTDNADHRAVIAAGLRAYNEARAGPPNVRPLNVLLRDTEQRVLGGLWGRTYWDWLFVELLHVPESLRGHDLGRRLMAAAEDEARARGCVGVWLDTFGFQAPGFYERIGYQRFGVLSDFPPGHERVYLAKRL